MCLSIYASLLRMCAAFYVVTSSLRGPVQKLLLTCFSFMDSLLNGLICYEVGPKSNLFIQLCYFSSYFRISKTNFYLSRLTRYINSQEKKSGADQLANITRAKNNLERNCVNIVYLLLFIYLYKHIYKLIVTKNK